MQFVVYVHVCISICLYSVCTISLGCRWFAVADRLVVLMECSVVIWLFSGNVQLSSGCSQGMFSCHLVVLRECSVVVWLFSGNVQLSSGCSQGMFSCRLVVLRECSVVVWLFSGNVQLLACLIVAVYYKTVLSFIFIIYRTA